MGIDELISDFYTKVHPYSAGKPHKMKIGQIAWIPTNFIDDNIMVIEAERVTAQTHNKVDIKFQRLNSDHFKRNEEKVPIPAFKLNPTEELVSYKAKKRPCVYIGRTDNLVTEDAKKLYKGKHHLVNSSMLFAPIYSTHKSDEMKGYPEELVLRVQYFQYTHLLYLGDCKLKGLESYNSLKEGIIRLDRIFSASPVVPNVSPSDIAISDEWMPFIEFHLKEFLFKETHPKLKEMRELLNDAFQD